jgi:PAS domain S-box-containing protein
VAAVFLSAWYYGLNGGLLATLASSGAVVYFFLRFEALEGLSHSAVVRFIGFLGVSLLITWVTASLRQSRTLFSSTLSSIADAVLVTDARGRVTFLNSVAETLTGLARREATGRNAAEVLRLVNESDHKSLDNPLAKALHERVLVTSISPTLLVSRSGAEIPVELSAAPVRDEFGDVHGGVVVFRDIAKRRQLEEQASHAEKMDAVSRLAGGVAGDFNNLLTVITGYAELLRAEVPAHHSMRRFVDEIIYAGERAAALTRHLLAFSRGPSAQPRVLDLNAVLSAMDPMLRRLLGDEIELVTLSGPRLGRVKADSAQIEQMIVNLANNARDAMPKGGKVVLETANVDLDEAGGKSLGIQPGTYVMLAVSDTGSGMDAATRSRLFEPFFTTKEAGKGSGLGLATVYGTVKQSGGHVTVYSQPGCGTIFEIYLPRVTETIAEPVRKSSPKGSETILLVDDEEGVRKLVFAVLKSNGYDVLEASNGNAALATYEKNAHKIDMVLTDVVMPQMTGFELGKELGDRAPQLKILYMSGYRDNAAAAGEQPRAFLHKPFTPDALLSKVREVLDSEAADTAM